MTQSSTPGYQFQTWKQSVFCVSPWKLLKNKISVHVSYTWHFVHCHCANLCSPPSLPSSQHREGLICGRQRSLCRYLSKQSPSSSRAQGLGAPGLLDRVSQKSELWWLRPNELAVSALQTAVISSHFFCLHI